MPLLIKALPFLAIAYLISLLDFVPDVVPVLGELGDVAIVLIALEVFVNVCPEFAVAFHRAAIAQGRRYSPMSATDTVIDAPALPTHGYSSRLVSELSSPDSEGLSS